MNAQKSRASLNAKVAAIALLTGAIALHGLNQLEASLLPARLFATGILVFGAWAFADEMGLRKPLNRAGFVSFAVAMTALAVTILEPGVISLHKYYLIYAFALLVAMVVWSLAYLHRQRDLKVLGALSAVATTLPLLILIAGHLSVGAAALFGVQLLLEPAGNPENMLTSAPIRTIEAVFIVWTIATAVFLWRGRMNPDKSLRVA